MPTRRLVIFAEIRMSACAATRHSHQLPPDTARFPFVARNIVTQLTEHQQREYSLQIGWSRIPDPAGDLRLDESPACGGFAHAEAQILAQVRRGLAATANLELFKDVVHVVLDGRQLDAQAARDLLV